VSQPEPSLTLLCALEALQQQEAKGFYKYGTVLDTAKLSPLELALHLQQEAADALMYATALVRVIQEKEAVK
jgi:hypothetical protein